MITFYRHSKLSTLGFIKMLHVKRPRESLEKLKKNLVVTVRVDKIVNMFIISFQEDRQEP